MSVTLADPATDRGDDRFIVPGPISWGQYVSIHDALADRRGLRMTFVDGRLTFVSPSRAHEWEGERLGMLVIALAQGLGIPWEDAGHATYRRADLESGVEGDKTFYFGEEHARLMRGTVAVDLDAQPPPDLAIEVEVTHPADDAVTIWGRLGVPEVWRFRHETGRVAFWHRRADGSYVAAETSLHLPGLRPGDVDAQVRLAGELGASRWHAQLPGWVRDVVLTRASNSL